VMKSPMVGTFYRRPSPDASNFVEEGASIKEGATVCIIEAMKMMNQIAADKTGVIKKILVADGESAVFKHTTGTGDLAANKAFLRTTTNVTAEGARGFSFDFGGGETTAVTEVELDGDNNSGKCYTLQGKEVRTPSKGLYIVNGKKVIIK